MGILRSNLLGIMAALIITISTLSHAWGEGVCQEVRVACNLPLTGALATYGTAIQEGVRLAQDDLPVTKFPITYQWEDNMSSAKEAVLALQKQLLSDPSLYVSGVKPQFMAIHQQIAKAKFPHFVWIFDVNIRPVNESNFRTWTNFKAEPPLFISYAKELRPKRIAIVYVQLPHTEEEYLNWIIPGLKEAGFNDLKIEAYPMDQLDFKPTAARLTAYKPDMLILSGFQENYVSMIRTFSNHNLIREANTVASYDLLDAAPLLDQKEIEGIRVSTPSFLLQQDTPKVSKWIKTFEKKFNKKPLYTHAYAYDMADAIASATNALESTCSPAELEKALYKVDKQGVTGRLKFDSSGDLPSSIELGVFRNGIVVSDK